MTLLDGSPAYRIGWMLLHSTWQLAALAAVLAVALRLLHRRSAEARYLAACAVMVAMAAAPIATLWLQASWSEDRPTPLSLTGGRPAVPGDPAGSIASIPRSSTPIQWSPAGPFEAFVPWLTALWLAGVGLMAGRLLGGWLRVSRLVSRRAGAVGGGREETLARIGRDLGVRRAVSLLESSLVAAPMVIGWLRPTILLPVSALTGLPTRQLEAILAHELAHIRRHDYLINLIQSLIEIVLFHHPAVWWASRAIRREREHCCDDLAVRTCGDRLTYARALTAMEELRGPRLLLSQAATGGTLLARIRRILDTEGESMKMKPFRGVVGLAALLAAGSLCLAGAYARQTRHPVKIADEPASSERHSKSMTRPVDDPPAKSRPGGSTQYRASVREYQDLEVHLEEKQGRAPTKERKGQPIDGSKEEYLLGVIIIEGNERTADPNARRVARRETATAGTIEDRECVPILDAAAHSAPPDQKEILAKVPRSRAKSERKNVQFVIEKIGDKVDPYKIYPLAGACQLVHRHYKCTVDFDEVFRSDYPIPYVHTKHRVEVVYLDKDYLRRYTPETDERRTDEVEKKINRLIEELQGLKKELRR